jgi:adenine deaminase
MNDLKISGNICDPVSRRIFSGEITVSNGIITDIVENQLITENYYILPGLIDSHVHIESSMLAPSEFARAAVVHGTVATVSDPHEIANVCGIEGVNFMIENGESVPFKFFFGAPSCVPATSFESTGSEITANDIRTLLSNPKIKYLSEMMNFPGVLYDFPDVIEKLVIAKSFNKPIDGHAPGLKGEQAAQYISAGISTDHECFTIEEAVEKINLGMKILIREGTAAKNFETLHSLLTSHPEFCMLCSDDKHPDDLLLAHINRILARTVAKGHDFFDVLRSATVNPVKHYNLEVGLLQVNDPADFIIVNNLVDFDVLKTYIDGRLVAENGKTLIDKIDFEPINNFNCEFKSVEDFEIYSEKEVNVNVIEAIEGELITTKATAFLKPVDGKLVSDINQDVLKISVVNRYNNAKPSVAFIKNFGLKKGALASSIGHDSHNIIAIGTNDIELTNAVNAVIEFKGGIAVVNGEDKIILPLPLAGLMSVDSAQVTAEKYTALNSKASELGCSIHSPFMTLSFMALLVIPYIKLSDKGLFDGSKFEFMELINNAD